MGSLGEQQSHGRGSGDLAARMVRDDAAPSARIVRPAAADWTPTSASELDHLRRCWPMYEVAFDADQVWHARHQAATEVMTAQTANEIRQKIRDDYSARRAPGQGWVAHE